jgi:hypothetical protein
MRSVNLYVYVLYIIDEQHAGLLSKWVLLLPRSGSRGAGSGGLCVGAGEQQGGFGMSILPLEEDGCIRWQVCLPPHFVFRRCLFFRKILRLPTHFDCMLYGMLSPPPLILHLLVLLLLLLLLPPPLLLLLLLLPRRNQRYCGYRRTFMSFFRIPLSGS